MKLDELSWCSNCLSMSTRNRITFDDRGWCNACRWMEKKKVLDWDKRGIELSQLLNKHKHKANSFDCIVPCSGGKDGSYVAHNLKTKYDINALAVTVTPPLPLELGEKNLKAFTNSGFSHISINVPYEPMRHLNKVGFIEMGFPYYGWLIAIHTAVIRVAMNFGINLIFYGEDGEIEYGGTGETEITPIYDINHQKKVYLEGGYKKVVEKSGLSKQELYFFEFPSDEEMNNNPIDFTHWSYFENWDPYRNYLVAKEFCGLLESNYTSEGTFTNYSQNDQALYALHTYLMYLKYGFGRANQDASIEIRRGAMDRDQGVNLVKLYDGQYPEEFIETYLNYYQMTIKEFDFVIDKYVNKDIFEKSNGRWKPRFVIR